MVEPGSEVLLDHDSQAALVLIDKIFQASQIMASDGGFVLDFHAHQPEIPLQHQVRLVPAVGAVMAILVALSQAFHPAEHLFRHHPFPG